MTGTFRAFALVASVSALAALSIATAPPVSAGPPGLELSVVPSFITIAPDGGVPGEALGIPIQVNSWLGGVSGSIVEIEFSEEAAQLIAWADPVPTGADVPVQTCPKRRYVKAADQTGRVVFHIAGGGCIMEPDFTGASHIVRVFADGVLLAERGVNSPDAVNEGGRLPTDGELHDPVCDNGTMSVDLADAVYHAAYFKTGTYNKCTDLAAPYGGSIDLGDVTLGSVYIKSGAGASCHAGCP